MIMDNDGYWMIMDNDGYWMIMDNNDNGDSQSVVYYR